MRAKIGPVMRDLVRKKLVHSMVYQPKYAIFLLVALSNAAGAQHTPFARPRLFFVQYSNRKTVFISRTLT